MSISAKMVGDTMVRVGDEFISNELAKERSICEAGTRVYIEVIKQDTFGIYSPDRHFDHWGSLDDLIDPGHGYWISTTDLVEAFSSKKTFYEIKGPLKFKNLELGGMKCELLRKLSGNDYVYVELEKSVGGSGADGLGKQGHCVIVPTAKLHKLSTKICQSIRRNHG